MADEFDADAAVRAYMGGTAPTPETALRASLQDTIGKNPDQVADWRRTAATIGVPLDTAEAMPDWSKQQAALKAIDTSALARMNPVTTGFLSDPNNAAISHDDTPSLSFVETSLTSIAKAARYIASADAQGGLVRDIGAGALRASAGAAGVFRAASEFQAIPFDPLVRAGILPGNPYGPVADYFARTGAQAEATAKGMSPPSDGLVGNAVSSGVQSLTSNLLALPMALMPGGQGAALAMLSGGAGGQAYQQAREQGKTAVEALPFAVSQGVIEYATEKLPMHLLLKDLSAGSAIGKTILHQAASEIPGEQIATVLQDMNEWAVLPENKDKPFSAYLADRPAAAAQTLIATVIGVGGQVTVMKAIQTAADNAAGIDRQAQAADQTAAKLEELTAAADGSKLKARDPQAFRQFVQDVAESNAEGSVPTEFYIDAEQLQNSLSQSGVTREELAALAPALAAQLDPANVVPGVDIRIPVSELLAAPSEITASLVDHLRETPDALTRAEAAEMVQQQGEQIQRDVTTQMTMAEEAQQAEQQSAEVRQYFEQQLSAAGRFRPEVNTAYASMLGSFYETQAQRAGMTPQELLSRYRLGVTSMIGGGSQRLNQPEAVVESAAEDREGNPYQIKVTKTWLGANRDTPSVLVEARDANGQRRGVIDFGVQDDGTLAAENTIVAAPYRGKGIAAAMYKAAAQAGYGIAPGRFQTEQGKGMVEALQRKGVIREGATNLITEETHTLNQEARGALSFGEDITAAPSVIALLKGADLSTFIHESGHFFLEVQADLASRIQGKILDGDAVTDGERQIVADMDTVLKSFGITGTPDQSALTTWLSMTLEEKREHHETFARSFERYAMEGAAPSQSLQAIFQRFRSWLVQVYKQLKALNVDLSDDVRMVFDRMLASDAAIQQAQDARAMGPLFQTAEQAGMTPEGFAEYHALAQLATDRAVSELDQRLLKDMKWLGRAKDKALKARQKEVAAMRREVRTEVTREVWAQPVYQAWQFLTGKGPVVQPGTVAAEDVDTVLGTGRLRTSLVKELDPTAAAELISRKMTSEKEGMHPDIVAEMFPTFTSGHHLVLELAAATEPNSLVDYLTDERMLELHGDITSPEALQRAADEAIHNDVRARVLATELKAQQALAVREPGARGKGSVDVIARAAREFAEQAIARQRVRDLRPGQYTAAEARSARLAEKTRSNLEESAQHKRNQLINNFAAKATMKAQDEVKAALKYFARIENSDTIDLDYRDQIAQLLERYQLKPESNRSADRRKSLAEWVKSQEDMGIEPDVPRDLLNGVGKQSYRDMTVEEMRGLVDTVKMIEHLGRVKNRLLTAKDGRDFAAARDQIEQSIIDNGQGRQADTRSPTTQGGRWLQTVKNFGAAHIKAATWARIMDGGKDGGPVWEHFIRGANEAGDMETTMRAEATTRLSEIMAPVMKAGKMGGKGRFFPSIQRSLNREAIFTIALNTGNEGNLQRLLGGEGWTLAQIKPALDTLSAQDWQAVQQVWDFFESYRPLIAAKERRVLGKEPNWVEPTPVITAHGTFRGGYYPIKYDPSASVRAEEHADAEGARQLLKGAYGAATTRRSFTKSRVEEVSGRPLLYTLTGMYGGANDVIHDLAWHEWLIDSNRLLRSDKIDTAMRETYGPAAVRQFKSWRDANAAGESASQDAVDMFSARIRQGVSVAGLGFNFMSAAMQPLGITQSIVRVGAGWVGKGIAQYIGAPIAKTREVNAKSEFMASRSRTRFRELNELRNRVEGQTVVREKLNAGAYVLMMRFQQAVDVPTWLGAYEKAVAGGNDEARSVALADQAVIDAQGGGQTKDLSAIERGSSTAKLLTVFYSFMNTALNVGVAQGMTNKNAAKTAADMALLYVVPAVLGALLKDALTPGDADDGDMDKLLKKLLAEQLGFLFGLFVGIREFTPLAKSMVGEGGGLNSYSGPAGLRVVPDAMKAAQQAQQGEFDDAFRKSAINLTGSLFGLPAAQINRTITGAIALNEGKTQNPAALALGFQEPK